MVMQLANIAYSFSNQTYQYGICSFQICNFYKKITIRKPFITP